jgi:hypothetical protein
LPDHAELLQRRLHPVRVDGGVHVPVQLFEERR